MNAKEIRRQVRKSGLYLYQVADEIGISDPTITRWLRRLDDEKVEKIKAAIDKLVQQDAAIN
ncbi:MAG: hypothetical protein ACOX8Q_09965 [Christensenellales bacterium]|jgi:transcriptional regulator with XRE-family HTH domain